MDKICKKCGRMIMSELFSYNEDGTPIFKEIYVKGNGNDVFCGYCATTCFFVNGEMIRGDKISRVKGEQLEMIKRIMVLKRLEES